MANWYNARLIVTGQRGDVLKFSRRASARPSSLFEPDMLQGEGMDLTIERMVTTESGVAKKVYLFQVRNDDGLEHFRPLSLQFPKLNFVLVYEDSTSGSYGSYFIALGKVQNYEVPAQVQQAILAKHGVLLDADTDDDDDIFNYWEASWELMDLAEAHWQDKLLGAKPR